MPVSNGMGTTRETQVAGEFNAKIIQDFTRDSASRLNEAALLEIEPLLHEESTLLNATSVVRRREHRVDPA